MSHDVTHLLARWSEGDQAALDGLLPILYEELKQLARIRLLNERPDHTMNTTALVHEAYLKLVDINRVQWTDRAHFLAMASRQMRRILVDYAHRRRALKRGGDALRVDFDEDRYLPDDYAGTLLELDDALECFEKQHPRQAKAVDLHYFGGLTLEEAGEVLSVSAPTVMRDLRFAQAWIAKSWKV